MQVSWLHSIRTKLFVLIGVLVLFTIAGISGHNLYKFRRILEDQIEEKTLNLAENAIDGVNNQLRLWQGQVSQTLIQLSTSESARQTTYRDLVSVNPDFVSFQHLRTTEAGTQSIFFEFTEKTKNLNFEAQDPKKVSNQIQADTEAWVKTFKPDAVKEPFFLRNISSAAGVSLFQIAVPAVTGKNSLDWGILSIWQQPLVHLLPQADQVDSFLVQLDGRILISGSTEEVFHPEIQRNQPVVQVAISGKSTLGSRKYIDGQDTKKIGAFSWSKEFQLGSIVLRNPQAAYDAINKEIWNTILLTILILLGVMLISYHSAGQLTRNLQKLTEVTQRIATGDLKSTIEIHTKDEVHELGISISHMAEQIHNLLEKTAEAARQEKELETAKIVQQTLFPKKDVESLFFTATGKYFPASECGGDWWGHFTTESDLEFICIADATGHGAAAALVTAIAFSSCMMLARTLQHAYEEAPDKILARFNEVLWEAGRGLTTMTFFAAFLNKKTGVLSFANAGHNLPLLIPENPEDVRLQKKGTKTQRYLVMQNRGIPLGLEPDSQYTKKTLSIAPGDKLFFYTDGLIECKNKLGVMWGKQNMLQVLEATAAESPERVKEETLSQAFSFFEDTPLEDDITVVVAEIGKLWSASEPAYG